ncbi:hypothetical protein [Haloplasma contractile]|uniref:Uncharacterized protein n=1 Tax=Haloplasma contractile SSD-17B TaxID=1033810 RepID=U2DSR4_9MOLU|nr:hypothetical protein [Haloplasma contractile]ERJ11532.1 hypothetical protein HLPCO_002444 [Haloplasma contractile SSD-17B]
MSYLPLMNRPLLRPVNNGVRYVSHEDEERYGLLPFLAGVAITAPFWFRRPCCPPFYNYSYYNYGYGPRPYANPGYGYGYGGYGGYGF